MSLSVVHFIVYLSLSVVPVYFMHLFRFLCTFVKCEEIENKALGLIIGYLIW